MPKETRVPPGTLMMLVLRVLGPGVERVREILVRAWQRLRPEVIGQKPHTPRIWST